MDRHHVCMPGNGGGGQRGQWTSTELLELFAKHGKSNGLRNQIAVVCTSTLPSLTDGNRQAFSAKKAKKSLGRKVRYEYALKRNRKQNRSL